jgi:hypothetical protein
MQSKKKTKLVHGIGVNDADYPVCVRSVIGEGRFVRRQCPFYTTWSCMLKRCYGKNHQSKYPTYIDCHVDTEWLLFSSFREWMEGQNWNGNQLDKDILIPGNKVYGPDTCVFIPGQINKFMNEYRAARGEWPIGVCWDKGSGKFRAFCHNPFTGKGNGLGRFACPNTAHEAWRARKHEHACRYADQQSDPRIAAALRMRYAKPSGEIQ